MLEHEKNVEIVEYAKDGLSRDNIELIIKQYRGSIGDLVRDNAELREQYQVTDEKPWSAEQILDVLTVDIAVMQRPLIQHEDQIFIARPPEPIISEIIG